MHSLKIILRVVNSRFFPQSMRHRTKFGQPGSFWTKIFHSSLFIGHINIATWTVLHRLEAAHQRRDDLAGIAPPLLAAPVRMDPVPVPMAAVMAAPLPATPTMLPGFLNAFVVAFFSAALCLGQSPSGRSPSPLLLFMALVLS